MTTLAALDSLGILFGGAAIVVYFAAVLLIARICGQNDRLAQGQREELAERLETEHPVTSISAYMAESERRAARARFRHSTRHSRWSA